MKTEAQKARKRRQNASRMERFKAKMRSLRESGAICGNCNGFDGVGVCETHSTGMWTQMATPEGICDRWSPSPKSDTKEGVE